MKRIHFLKNVALTSVIIFNCATVNAARNFRANYDKDAEYSFVNFSAFIYSFGSERSAFTASSDTNSGSNTTTNYSGVSNSDFVQFGQEATGYNPNQNPISEPEIRQEIENMSPQAADQPTDNENMEAVWDSIIAGLAPTDTPLDGPDGSDFLNDPEMSQFIAETNAAAAGLLDSDQVVQGDFTPGPESSGYEDLSAMVGDGFSGGDSFSGGGGGGKNNDYASVCN